MFVASEVMLYQMLKDLVAEGLTLDEARDRIVREVDEAYDEIGNPQE